MQLHPAAWLNRQKINKRNFYHRDKRREVLWAHFLPKKADKEVRRARMLSVQQLFDQYANPLYGSFYAASAAVSEFTSKSTPTNSSSVELVFSAAAISSLAQAGFDVSAIGAYGGVDFYGSDGSLMSFQTDMTSLFQALA